MCATCLRRAERYARLGAGGQLDTWMRSRLEFYAHVSVLVRGSRTRHVQTQRFNCLAGVGTEYPPAAAGPDATGALKGSPGEATSAPCPSWHHSIVRPCIDQPRILGRVPGPDARRHIGFKLDRCPQKPCSTVCRQLLLLFPPLQSSIPHELYSRCSPVWSPLVFNLDPLVADRHYSSSEAIDGESGIYHYGDA